MFKAFGNSIPRYVSEGRASNWDMLRLEENLNSETFISALLKCRKGRKLAHAKEVYASLCYNGLESHKTISNYIVAMFVECACMSDAHQAFNRLIYQNEHSWTSLILGYIECGQPQLAISLYDNMQDDGVHPSSYTLRTLIGACARNGNLERGRQFHVEIIHRGFEGDPSVGSSVIDMYTKCGALTQAQETFDRLPDRNVVSWTALIVGFLEHGLVQDILKCYDQMLLNGLIPDAAMFVCILKACGSIGALEKAQEIHTEIANRQLERELSIGNTLIDMYAKCGCLGKAREVFDKLPTRDSVSWTALISGYADHGFGHEALKCFQQMQQDGFSPDALTFVCSLKACASIGALHEGQKIHVQIAQTQLADNVFIGNSLVDMYGKCGSMVVAQQVFEELPLRDIVSWNALISGYVENGFGQEALNCFEQMRKQGVSANVVTFVSILKACGSIRSLDKGRKIHTEVLLRAFDKNFYVGSSLIDMYAKCGSIIDAQEVFENLPDCNIMSLNALLSAYAENGLDQEVLKCFEQVELKGTPPDAVTFIYVLGACGSIGALQKGREIHKKILKMGLDGSLLVGSSLVDMYAKCGSLAEARDVFDKLPVRNIASWNAMIRGYGMNHDSHMAVQCYKDMEREGINPNDITFICLLTACSRASLINVGQQHFKAMRDEYGIVPMPYHFTCMVDLLARSGHLHEAEKLLQTAHCAQTKETWIALLSACNTYGEAELGLRCLQKLCQIQPENAAAFVLMTNIYTNSGKWGTNCLEELKSRLGEKIGSLISVAKVHEFVVGNDQTEEISVIMKNLSSWMEGVDYATDMGIFGYERKGLVSWAC